MISALLVSTLLGAGPPSGLDLGAAIRDIRRTFIEDGADRVSSTATHRVVSHADGSLELQGPQPLRLSLQSVRRERGSSCRTELLSREIDPASLHTVRAWRACELEETWTNDASGLEHAFTLKRRPPGSGGLTLFLSVQGPWHHQDQAGNVFQGPGEAALLRYGNAFVIRDGKRLPISVVHVEGGLELRVPQALVDAPHAFPMIIDPLLSMELPLDPSPRYGTLSTQEDNPAIAVNSAGTAMVVWVDNRRQLGTDLYGARISTAGTLIDQTGLALVATPGHQLRPTICADGLNFLIAWEAPLALGPPQIKLRRVAPGGANLGEATVGPGSHPSLASTGAGYNLLAYVNSANVVQVAQVTGLVVGTRTMRATVNNGLESRPRIAATNRSWFVAWEHALTPISNPSIQGMGASGDGGTGLSANLPMIPLSLPSPTAARRPTVALSSQTQGEEVSVFWDQGDGIVGARFINPLGIAYTTVTGENPALVRTSTALGVQPTLGYFESGFLRLLDLNDAGVRSYNVGTGPTDLVLAASGSIYAAWTDRSLGGTDVFGLSTGFQAGATPLIPLARAFTTQLNPHVALRDGKGEGLAVWVEGTQILGAKVISQNTSLSFDPSFPIAGGGEAIAEVDVAAAGADDTFLVTWRQSGGALMAQLATSTGVDQSGPLTLSPDGARVGPTVAWDESGSHFVVAWTRVENLSIALVSQIIELDGSVSELRSHTMGGAFEVDLTCLKGQCLLAWDRGGDVMALTIDTSAPSTPIFRGRADHAVVAHDGNNFFLGWRSDTGISLAEVDFITGVATDLPGSPLMNRAAQLTRLSLASAKPPVVAWSELAPNDETHVFISQIDFQGPAIHVAAGLLPVVTTSSVQAGPQGVVVYERYLSEDRFQSVRSFGLAFEFPFDAGMPDAGSSDAGSVDAGLVDAGEPIDAGSGDGGVDAGMLADAGMMVFETSGCDGCNSASVAPLLVFALLLLRRRRTLRF